MRFVVFFAVLFTIIGGMCVFIYRRVNTVFAPRMLLSRSMLAIMLSGMFLLFLKRYAPAGNIERLVGVAGGSITVAVILTFVLLLVALIVERGIAAIAHAAGVRSESAAVVTSPAQLTYADAAVPDSASARHALPEEAAELEAPPLSADEVAEAQVEAAIATAESPAADSQQTDDVPEVTKELTGLLGLGAHPQLGRRGFLAQVSTGAALAVGSTTSMYAGIFGRHDYVIEEVPIKLARLPASHDGFTIVQLSDLHIGSFVGETEILAALELVKKAKPDLIVLTGDLLDHDAAYGPKLGSFARRLGERAPVVGIVGNHDYYAGVNATMNALRRANAEVLFNEGKRIAEGKLALLGVDDVWARRRVRGGGPDVQSALATMPQDLPRILLCHNPSYFPEASPHVDLQLSGHTHGGQINLGLRPAEYVLPYGYVEGHYERDNAQLWVNRGFGTAGPPARLQAPPEITKVILTV